MFRLKSWLFAYWDKLLFYAILLFIMAVNFRPGYFVLGNDNFSPELNPGLTIERSLLSPAWREYRALGMPSDSEQADLFRSVLFWLSEKIIPAWLTSQSYLFFTFIIAAISMGSLVQILADKFFDKKFSRIAFLFGGLFYTANLITSWIYFFPLQLFVAAYAFLPFVLWRIAKLFEKRNLRNFLLLLIASLFLSTAGLTATMYLVCAITILSFVIFFAFLYSRNPKKAILASLLAILSTIVIQSYWILPFFSYVKTNSKALQESLINRTITPTTVETEQKYNTALNSLRYYFSWMDTKENGVDYTFQDRDWYKKSAFATLLSFLPLSLALVSVAYVLKKRRKSFFILIGIFLGGWILIKGVNPPFGNLYSLLQNNSFFNQVFRWQSSKFWPLLANTMPILATFGLLQILILLKNRLLRGVLLASIFVGLLIFVKPYFEGNLVRKEVFVKIPQEYFALSNYLSQNDKTSRIYAAPEANTLYFRNYDWGFWGSTILNYIVPNPIIEKALIIGSSENEQAFTVLKNALYSENPYIFSTALKLYQTPLVLLDKHVSQGNVGYEYNWDVVKKSIERNPELKKIWEQGGLSLYRLKKYESLLTEAVYNKTDFEKLNQIKITSLNSQSYFAGERSGAIYPFALNFERFEQKEDEIVATTTYVGDKTNYVLGLDVSLLNHSPVQIQFDPTGQKLNFFPLLPFISVNNKAYPYKLPYKQYVLGGEARIISINNQVADLRGSGLKGSEVIFGNLDSNSIKAWTGKHEGINVLLGNQLSCDGLFSQSSFVVKKNSLLRCSIRPIGVNQDTVVEMLLELESKGPIGLTTCFDSIEKRECINSKTTVYLHEKERIPVELLSSRVLSEGDGFITYLNFDNKSDKDITVSLKKFIINLFSENREGVFVGSTQPLDNILTLSLKDKDLFALHIPMFDGQNGWQLRKELMPDSSIFLDKTDEESLGEIKRLSNKTVEFKNKESNSILYSVLPHVDGASGLGMVFATGENTSAIPLSIFLRDKDWNYSLFENRFYPKKESQVFDLFTLPQGTKQYVIEAKTQGIGPKLSRNILDNLVFRLVPQSWYSLKLIPLGDKAFRGVMPLNNLDGLMGNVNSGFNSIPSAYSNNWKLTIDGKKEENRILINGWQQGWEVVRGGEAKAQYDLNRWAYAGFFPVVGFYIIVVFQGIALFLSRFLFWIKPEKLKDIYP